VIRPRVIGLIASREITERLSGRATWIVTGLTAVLAAGLIVVPALINQQSGPTRLGLVGSRAQALAPALTAAGRSAGVSLTTAPVASISAARDELTPKQSQGGGGGLARLLGGSNARLDVVLAFDGGSATILAYQTVPPATLALVHAVLDAAHQRAVLSASGVAPSTITSSLSPVPVTAETIQPTPGDRAGLNIAALASAFLLMYAVTGFGGQVATGVAQEKTTRTAELLVSAVHPRELMTGKVLGIGLVGLGMMTVTVGAALIANTFVKSAAIPPELGPLLPQVLLWFVLGFTLYAFAFAAAGAMVARQEEVQSVAMPLAAVMVVALLLVYATLASPDSGWIRLLSFLPPLSPMLMPARSFRGSAQGWEVALAVGIELLAIAGTVTLTARIYQRALMRGGARLSWSQAIRLGGAARPD
jgi:ABC-2 type transport system permease protein